MFDLLHKYLDIIFPSHMTPAKLREQQLKELAHEWGLEFKSQVRKISLINEFYLSKTNLHKGFFSNLITSPNDTDTFGFKCFDHKIPEKNNIEQTVLFFSSKSYNFPKFHIIPNDNDLEIKTKLKLVKVQKTENGTFNQNYHFLWTDHEDPRIKKILDGNFLSILLNQTPSILVEGNNYYFMIHIPEKILQAQEIKELRQTALQLIDTFNNASING